MVHSRCDRSARARAAKRRPGPRVFRCGSARCRTRQRDRRRLGKIEPMGLAPGTAIVGGAASNDGAQALKGALTLGGGVSRRPVRPMNRRSALVRRERPKSLDCSFARRSGECRNMRDHRHRRPMCRVLLHRNCRSFRSTRHRRRSRSVPGTSERAGRTPQERESRSLGARDTRPAAVCGRSTRQRPRRNRRPRGCRHPRGGASRSPRRPFRRRRGVALVCTMPTRRLRAPHRRRWIEGPSRRAFERAAHVAVSTCAHATRAPLEADAR